MVTRMTPSLLATARRKTGSLSPSFILSSGSAGGESEARRRGRDPATAGRPRPAPRYPGSPAWPPPGPACCRFDAGEPLQQSPLGRRGLGVWPPRPRSASRACQAVSLPGCWLASACQAVCSAVSGCGARTHACSSSPECAGARQRGPASRGAQPGGQVVQQGHPSAGSPATSRPGPAAPPARSRPADRIGNPQGRQGGEGIGAEPEVAALGQQQLVGAEFSSAAPG